MLSKRVTANTEYSSWFISPNYSIMSCTAAKQKLNAVNIFTEEVRSINGKQVLNKPFPLLLSSKGETI